jgi:hypothetical protein
MDKTDNAAIGKPAPPTFTKKIGRTTYEVTVYFNENAREKLHKKLERIILNSVEKGDFL